MHRVWQVCKGFHVQGRRKRGSRHAPAWWLVTALVLGMAAWFLWPERGGDVPRPTIPKGASAQATNRPAAGWLAAGRVAVVPGQPVGSVQVTNRVAVPPRVPERLAESEPFEVRPVRDLLEAQVVLARLGISPGSIDGSGGYQTRTALRAFQSRERLPVTGELDAATRERLVLRQPLFKRWRVTEADLARLHPVSRTWLGKSRQGALEFESLLEMLAERACSHPGLVRRLNPTVDWTNAVPGVEVVLPEVSPPPVREKAAFLRIEISARVLRAYDRATNLVAHFPCSIARRVEKRPVGELRVISVVENPDYRFDPAIFPESAEARTLKGPLRIPPGPNNPVGRAWIGLSLPGYGIHGTPRPEDVGRTESHGCFRLANWNAQHLARLAWSGMPVRVDP